MKTLEGVARTAAVSLYYSMARSFVWRYGVPDTRPQPGSVAAEELERHLRETVAAYRDDEYSERRRRAADPASRAGEAVQDVRGDRLPGTGRLTAGLYEK